jgi:hypothetical protein
MSRQLPADHATGYAARTEATTITLARPAAWLGTWIRTHRGDVASLSALAGLIAIGMWLRWVYDNWLGEFDLFTMFMPWFGYIGDRLAAGELPAWSPHYFGGAPVIGNPSGGWMYLQVMVLYAMFPILTATKMLLLTHSIIAGVAVYAFCRKLGLVPVAALVSSSAYVLGQIMYGGTNFLTIATQTSTWMAVGMLAAEMALRARRTSGLLGWSTLLGVAITQMFVAWPGQGVVYGGILIGGWVLYRILVAPPPEMPKQADRLWQAVLLGSAAGFSFLGFGAAGILPMLDFLHESTVPGGDYSNVVGGDYAETTDSIGDYVGALFRGNVNFNFTVPSESFGAVIMILAIIGAIYGGRRYGALYFSAIFVAGASLQITGSPIMWAFEQLPVIGPIHSHRPSGVSWLIAYCPCLLAGIAVQRLHDRDRIRMSTGMATFLLGILAIGFATAASMNSWMGWWSWISAVSVVALFMLPSTDIRDVLQHLRDGRTAQRMTLGAVAFGLILALGYLWDGFWILILLLVASLVVLQTAPQVIDRVARLSPHFPTIIGAIVVGLILLHPTGYDIYATVQDPESAVGGWTDSPGKEPESDWVIKTTQLREDPGTAAEFLQQQMAIAGPFRYAGWSLQGEVDARWTGQDKEGHKSGYSWRRFEPGVVGILVNGRTYRLDLMQTGGYNPIQIRWWTEYVDVMNQRRQDYHWLDMFGPALTGSPLLNMLDVRYILVDKTVPDWRPTVQGIEQTHTMVYEDNLVRVYENQQSLGHAWIVHDLGDNGDGDGLRLLESGNADPASIAFINSDHEFPTLQPAPTDGSREFAVVTRYEPETVTLRTQSTTDGFLVVSDPYASGWNAYIDGEQTEIFRTNHALRGIALPAGEHIVEFRYEPESVRNGLIITGGTSVILIVIWAWAFLDWRRRGWKDGAPAAVVAMPVEPTTALPDTVRDGMTQPEPPPIPAEPDSSARTSRFARLRRRQ